MTEPRGRVLVIAGSDSGAGAGIQADLKTIMALGGYAATAITAITVQNTQGVFGVHEVPPDIVAGQIRAVLDDIGADAVKTGMLGSAAAVRAAIGALLERAHRPPLVVDPVITATQGATLASNDAVEVMKAELIRRSEIVTPNIPEAEVLAGFAIRDVDDMKRAAERLLALGAEAVLVKGGHLPSSAITDVLLTSDGFTLLTGERLPGRNTHGTGCTLASAIACGIAQGMDVVSAVERARDYVRAAIAAAPGLGRGHGPLNHGHSISPYRSRSG